MSALSRIKNLESRIKLLMPLFLILIALFLPKNAFAQTPASSTSKESKPTFEVSQAIPTTNYQLPTTISPTSPLYTDLIVNNMFHTFSCLAIGQSLIGQPCLTYQVTRNAQGAIQSVPVLSQVNLSGGTLGAVTSVIGALYMNPPVRTADYLASLGQGLGVGKVAHAQGVTGSGAAVLSPILTLWQVSRNISYVIMIIIFVVIGLMIMFRNKLNPQTVITAQTALPGLVIGLILITFSYFLAGLISDMAFVGTNIVGYYFSTASGQTSPQNLVEDMKDKNVLSIFSPFTSILNQGNISHALDSIWKYLERPNRQQSNPLDMDPSRALTALAALMATQFVLPFASMLGGIGQIVGGLVTFTVTAMNPTGVAGWALSFIAMLILIYAMLKLLLRLINNYITIIFLTISAPFQFLAASLPGRQGLATNWILNMLANILAFPAVLAVFYFVAFLMPPEFINDYGLNPPFKVSQSQKITGSANFPLFGNMDISFINLLLAFGALVALPSIPDIIGRTIGRMSQVGQLIGQEIGSGVGQGQRYAGQFQQGPSGMAGQVGRLTNTTGVQYFYDPTIDPQTGRPAGLVATRTVQPGQLTRAGMGWTNFWSTGLGGRARRRTGI